MVSDTFHFALICTFIAIKIVSPLRGLKLDNAPILCITIRISKLHNTSIHLLFNFQQLKVPMPLNIQCISYEYR